MPTERRTGSRAWLTACSLGLVAALSSGCSFDVPKHSGMVNITVKGDNANAVRAAEAPLTWLDDFMAEAFFPGASSSAGAHGAIRAQGTLTLANFGCYAVNITGQGVQATPTQLQNCKSPNNMNGTGVGAISKTFPAGQSVSAQVPSNVPITVNVYGVYPPDQTNCPNAPGAGQGSSNNGGGSGYLLGGVTQTLASDSSVSIGTSYSGAPADVVCSGGGGGGGGNSFFVGGTFPFGGDSSGGWTMQVYGGGFISPATVSIGSTPCATTTFVSSSQLNCLVPSGLTSQGYSVTVTNAGGATATQSGIYFWINTGGEYVSVYPFSNGNQTLTFGNVAVGSVQDITVTLQNTGANDTAYAPAALSLSGAFRYGGGAGYPGAGGTCNTGTIIQGITNHPPNGGSCTVVLEFAPTSKGAASLASPIYFLNPSDPAYNGANYSGGLSGTGI